MKRGKNATSIRPGKGPRGRPARPPRTGGDGPTGDVPRQPLHPQAVRQARRGRASDHRLSHLADTFQMLANPTRLRIVEALTRRDLCVWDLALLAGTSQSAASHHLRQLRQMRIVRYRREGRLAVYSLDDEHIAELFRIGCEHVAER